MSYLRFNHVFLGLLAVAFFSVMFLPARVSKTGQANVQGLFVPVAAPVRGISSWIHGKIFTPALRDDGSPAQPRPDRTILTENQELRQQIALLTTELQKLQAVDAERNRLSWLRDLCTPVTVIGGDSGQGGLLHLQASSLQGLRDGMPAIVADGLVGRIERSGVAGASVQLITARGTRLGVKLGRFITGEGMRATFHTRPELSTIAASRGDGTFITELIKWDDLDGDIAANDWVVLEDPEWPKLLQGYRVGKVIEVTRERSAPAWGRVRFEPVLNLTQLREVMVMKEGSGFRVQGSAISKVSD